MALPDHAHPCPPEQSTPGPPHAMPPRSRPLALSGPETLPETMAHFQLWSPHPPQSWDYRGGGRLAGTHSSVSSRGDCRWGREGDRTVLRGPSRSGVLSEQHRCAENMGSLPEGLPGGRTLPPSALPTALWSEVCLTTMMFYQSPAQLWLGTEPETSEPHPCKVLSLLMGLMGHLQGRD